MRKTVLTILFSMFLLFGLTAHAACFKGGSFIGVRGSNASDAILDQFIFQPDGTAYWNQSRSLNFPLTGGTFLPQVGTWEISRCGKHVIVTTIGASALPVQGGSDVDVSFYTRTTQQFKINKKGGTLTAEHRVQRSIPFNEDPLTSQGTVTLNSFIHFKLKPVKVRVSDLEV